MEATSLAALWKARCELQRFAVKLREEGGKMYEFNSRNSVLGVLARADGALKCAESSILRAQACKLFFNAVFQEFGNVKVDWVWRGKDMDCVLENGFVFKHDAV